MFTVETDFPIARPTLDPGNPLGIRIDNNTNRRLIEEVERYFQGKKIYSLDLGCSGGQFIVDLHKRGHKALGIEGSDDALKHQGANWPKYHRRVLFTADLARPLHIKESGKTVQFHSVTAWGLLEHLRPEDLRGVLSRIENLLDKDGLFWGSIATVEGVTDGVRLPQSVFPKEKWLQEILPEFFEVVPYGFRNSIPELGVRLGESFLFMCKKRGTRKLNLGCGGNILPGWENHDADLDISKPLLFPDRTFDYILAEHVIEHISIQEGYRFLRECFRVLKAGGVLRVCVPGVDKIFRNYSEEYGLFIQRAGFGERNRQAAIETMLFGHGHQAAWTEELLRILLQVIGLHPEKAGPRVSRHKELQDVDGHWKVIGEKPNAVETIALEAVKGPEALVPIHAGWSERPGKKIAVGLIEHLGDIVACEPVARYLRNLHADAEITWVVREPYRELIDHNPQIDCTLTIDCLSEWIRITESSLFDEIIDLHVNRRVCTVRGKTLNKKIGNPEVDVEKYFQYGSLLSAFCQGAGLPPLKDAPQVYIPESAVEKVKALGLPPQALVIHGTSNEVSKDWPATKWVRLVEHLVREMNLTVVEVGTNSVCHPGEKGWGPLYVNLCGKLSILETAEVIRRASLFLGVDSGPAHLANAVGTPGLILMGEYRIYKRYMPFTGAYAEKKNNACLFSLKGPAAALPVTTVLEAVSDKMGIPRPKPPLGLAQPSLREEKKVEIRDQGEATAGLKVPRVIAFYLPQFHPIPENDHWWGRGFTEWTNVSRAKPLFPGHEQPHKPGELGFYDLRLPKIREKQADLAREAGIYGFCYYHYWFHGKRLLQKPLEEILSSGTPDFPFCLCWANENWTRVWDGGSNQIIMTQEYSEDDDLAHIQYLSTVFRDRRYIRVREKPLFLVYRANRLPDPVKTTALWREEARRQGIGELYLCRVESFPDEHNDPSPLGFDGAVEFQPDWTGLGAQLADPCYRGNSVYRYEDVAQQMLAKGRAPYKRFPCVTPSWDNSARRKKGATIFINSTPAVYEQWLRETLQRLEDAEKEEKIVFVNAWNEWGEGNHLEPDQKFGRSYLEATRRALTASREDCLKEEAAQEAYAAIQQEFLQPGKWEEAIDVLEKWALANPRHGIAHNDLGVLYYQRGEKAKALASYEKAVRLNPQNTSFQKNLAEYYFAELGKTEEAVGILTGILEMNPREVEALIMMGKICFLLGRYADAAMFAKKAMEIDADNRDGREILANLPGGVSTESISMQNPTPKAALRQRDRRDQEGFSPAGPRRVTVEAGASGDLNHPAGLYSGRMEQTSKGSESPPQGPANHPDNLESLLSLGHKHLKSQRPEEARSFYRKALQLSSHPRVAQEIVRSFEESFSGCQSPPEDSAVAARKV